MICEHGSLKRSCPHCEAVELCLELNAMEAENKRMRTALEFIVRDSACHGVNCSWGDNCYAVVANQALNPEVTANATQESGTEAAD